MKHYTYFRSSAAYRVRIALNLKGIAPEPIAIHLTKDGGKQHSPEYRAVNPQRRVPSLVLDDGEVLMQSPGHHRVSRRDPSQARVPAGRSGRARQGARLRRADRLRHSPAQQPCPAAISQARAEAGAAGDRRMVSALGDRGLHRARNHDPARARIVSASNVTLADIYLVPQMYNARRLKVPLEAFPKLVAADAALAKLPAFDKARPENQPDAE